MAGSWIVVANRTRARIFTPVKHGQALELARELLHPASRAHPRDLASDRPGRSFDREGPGRHAMGESVRPKEHEAKKLCKELVDEIETARVQGRFERLILVAAPSFLGELRKSLRDPASRLVVKELDKDLAHMNARQIMDHLPDLSALTG